MWLTVALIGVGVGLLVVSTVIVVLLVRSERSQQQAYPDLIDVQALTNAISRNEKRLKEVELWWGETANELCDLQDKLGAKGLLNVTEKEWDRYWGENDCSDCLTAGECLHPPCPVSEISEVDRGLTTEEAGMRWTGCGYERLWERTPAEETALKMGLIGPHERFESAPVTTVTCNNFEDFLRMAGMPVDATEVTAPTVDECVVPDVLRFQINDTAVTAGNTESKPNPNFIMSSSVYKEGGD